MKILVTGGAGFIGSNFLHYWTKNHPDDQIRVLDKLTYAGHVENLNKIKKNFEFTLGDICDPEIVQEAMSEIDIVVHFAAESHVDRSVLGPQIFLLSNVIGTQVLLDEALRRGIKLFHHVSTDEVFGDLPLEEPNLKFDENSPLRPSTPYATSKAASDLLVSSYHKTYGLPVTISNTSNNYGPRQDPEKLIPRFITNLLEDKEVPLMGKGENIRDWIHVEDHCTAIDTIIHRALEDKTILGERFCVGGDSEKTNLEVTKKILEILGKDDSYINFIAHRLGHDRRYAINSSKINKLLGWKPEYTFDEGLKKTIDWYTQNKTWWKPLKEGRPDVDPERQINKFIERN